jgi:nucleotide-binding universal stress UspA family protein
LADELRTHEVAIRTRVVNGPAAEVLVDEAAQCRIDLIVMATHYSGPRCQDTDLDQNQWIALLSCAENP